MEEDYAKGERRGNRIQLKNKNRKKKLQDEVEQQDFNIHEVEVVRGDMLITIQIMTVIRLIKAKVLIAEIIHIGIMDIITSINLITTTMHSIKLLTQDEKKNI